MKTYGTGVAASRITGVSLKKRFTIGNATAWLHLRTACAVRLLPLPLLLLLALPVVGQALDYTYTANASTVTITGYTGPGGEVTIPGTIDGLPVTYIGASAFSHCTNLTSVTLPDGISKIGDLAFFACTNLTSVTLPDGISRILGWAFLECTSLTSVTIPNSVDLIGESAFVGCTSLTAITVNEINPFYCSVAGVLFNNSQTRLIQYPAGKGGSYLIPDSVTSIGQYAFADCSSLFSVTIPNNVTSIGDWAFLDCTSLASITIPNSVTDIGAGAFGGCTTMVAITVDPLNSKYRSVDGVVFGKNLPRLTQYPAGKAGSYTIPDSVIIIMQNAFYGCCCLTSVTIPKSVASIGLDAFSRCSSLTAITVDSLNFTYSSMAGVLFDKSQTTLIHYPEVKAGGYTIPNSVIGTGIRAFFCCTNLTSVTIPNSVTRLGNWAFDGCTKLVGVYFKGNAPSIYADVFDGASTATVYYLPGTTGWSTTYGGRPTALWKPLVLNSDVSFGVRTNQFGFNIAWTSGQAVVVEACTDLVHPTWSPLQTNTLTGDSFYFSDPQWTNDPGRFYRLRSP